MLHCGRLCVRTVGPAAQSLTVRSIRNEQNWLEADWGLGCHCLGGRNGVRNELRFDRRGLN